MSPFVWLSECIQRFILKAFSWEQKWSIKIKFYIHQMILDLACEHQHFSKDCSNPRSQQETLIRAGPPAMNGNWHCSVFAHKPKVSTRSVRKLLCRVLPQKMTSGFFCTTEDFIIQLMISVHRVDSRSVLPYMWALYCAYIIPFYKKKKKHENCW